MSFEIQFRLRADQGLLVRCSEGFPVDDVTRVQDEVRVVAEKIQELVFLTGSIAISC